MVVERWEMTPSSMPDRYVLKVRGDRADVDKLAGLFGRVCQEVRELSDPVYRWGVVVVGASLSERLSIQDQLREMSRPAAAPASKPVQPSDLSGVLSELSMVLGDLTGLTAEEQAYVAKKRDERQERKGRTIPPMVLTPPTTAPEPAPAVPPSPPPAERKPPAPEIVTGPTTLSSSPPPPPPAPAPSKPPEEIKPKRAEPVFEIVHDVAPAPSRPAEKTPPASAPAGKIPEKPAAEIKQAAAPAPAAPAPVPADIAADQLIKAACFYAPGGEAIKDAFLGKLTEVAQKKAKKPFFIQPVLSQSTAISNKQGAEWARLGKAAGAEVVFILLPPDLGADFLDQAVVQIEMAGMHGYLITPAEIETRLLYVDLTVELMLVKRHK